MSSSKHGRVVDIDHGWKALKKSLTAAAHRGSYVKVGVLGKGGGRAGDGLSNAELAAVQEFGTMNGHIPARPFIGATYDMNRGKYVEQIRKDLGKVLEGKRTIEQTLARAGLKFSSDVKSVVVGDQWHFAPNAADTVRKKGSDRPLVDTGRMINSVSYEVVLQGQPGRSGKTRKG
jgi:HK97 gp10 family phage protein